MKFIENCAINRSVNNIRLSKIFLFLMWFLFGEVIAQNSEPNITTIKTIVKQWSDAHNNRDMDMLNSLYASKLLFYCKEQPREVCIEVKRKALEASLNFRQDIASNIEIEFYQNDIIKCSFTKKVQSKKVKSYPAYLLLKAHNNNYLIIGESDQITDSNLNYDLNLGNPISFPKTRNKWDLNVEIYALILILILIFIVILFYRIRNQKRLTQLKLIDFNYHSFEEVQDRITADTIKKVTNQEVSDKAQKILTYSYSNTKSFVTKFFDKADNIDRKLYGNRMKIFIIGCFVVLFGAPFFDYVLNSDDIITFIATLIFLIFNLVIVFSFIGSWRDDKGNVTWDRTKSRIKTYYEILNDAVVNTRTSSQTELLYKLGQYLFFGGIGWATFKNLSLFVRKLIWYSLDIKIGPLLTFEQFTSQYFFLPVLGGIGIILYLYNNNPLIFERIKFELRQFVGISNSKRTKYNKEIVTINSNSTIDLVVNPKEGQQFNSVMALSNSILFNDFAYAVKNWNPRDSFYEYEYQDKLLRHLRKSLPEASIETEYPIGEKQLGTKGRADIVINNTILIEIKRDSSAGAIQRAKGQIAQYAEAWKNKGPVVLLLCDYSFEHAKNAFFSTMQDQMRLGRPVFTIVAKEK
jgi:hypothetical protein